jgi:hypothetical protein
MKKSAFNTFAILVSVFVVAFLILSTVSIWLSVDTECDDNRNEKSSSPIIEGLTDSNGNPIVDPTVCAQVMEVHNEYKAAMESASKKIMKIVYGQDNLSLYTDCINNLDNCPNICKINKVTTTAESISDPPNTTSTAKSSAASDAAE